MVQPMMEHGQLPGNLLVGMMMGVKSSVVRKKLYMFK